MWIQQFKVYDSGLAFKVSHVHSNEWQWVEIASTGLIFYTKKLAKIEEQRRKDLTLVQMQNEEDRHTLQTHTKNKEQMLRRASQVTFIASLLKYYFLLNNVVEWAILPKCLQVRCKSETYTLLISFSLICKADAVKKNILVKD